MGRGLDLKIGKYEVVEKIGEGGMGAVFKATDPLIDRIVAIKKMNAEFGSQPEWRDRFFQEAKVVGRLTHPNIVALYDLGMDGDSPYIVMEYLVGQGLDKLISTGQYLSAVQKIDYVIQVCNALHCAHQGGIMHRDIKPANVIVLQDLTHVKLVDFGIAKIGGGGSSGHTTRGMAIGTSGYMSPQQLLAAKNIDGRTDVFSTGVMLYQLFAGVLPWDAGEPLATAMKILNEPFPPLDTYVSDYPRELDDVLAHALAKDQDERITADEMAWELQRVQERLKRGLVSEYVNEARSAMERNDFAHAKEVLSDVLKLDTQNNEAREMMHVIRERAAKEQGAEKARQLKDTAEGAAARKQFTEAISAIDQAIRFDKTNPELANIRELILADQRRYQDVRKKLNLAEAAQKMEDYSEALALVERALELDPTDTQARMMQSGISQRIAEQQRQKQVRDLAEAAKREIQSRQFTSATDLLSQIESLDPRFADLANLKKAAAVGHEQEIRRRRLQAAATDIQEHLAAADLPGVMERLAVALAAYPNEPLLLELKAKADALKQRVEQDRFIDEQVRSADSLLTSNRATDAISVAEQLAVRYPADARVQALVEKSRARAAELRAERRRADVMAKAAEALRVDRPEAAVQILEAALNEFPGSNELTILLQQARRRAEQRQSEVASLIREVERDLAAGEADRALAVIDQQAPETRALPDVVRLREIATAERQRIAVLNSKLHNVEQQVRQRELTGAMDALSGLRSEFGEHPRIEQLSQEILSARASAAERAVTDALNKADTNLRKSAFAEARAALDSASRAVPHASPDLQARVAAMAEQITQSERAAQKTEADRVRFEAERKAIEEGERKAREEADRRAREESERQAREQAERKAREDAERKARELRPAETSILDFGGTAAATAPAKEAPAQPKSTAPVAEPARETKKQKKAAKHDSSPAVPEVKPQPRREPESPKAAPVTTYMPPPVLEPKPAPVAAPAAEKQGKGMLIGIAAAVVVVVLGAAVFFMKSGSKTEQPQTPPVTQTQPAEQRPVVAGSGNVTIDASPWAAFVIKSSDGKVAQQDYTPWAGSLPAGDYTVEFTGASGEKKTQNLKVEDGKSVDLNPNLGAPNASDIVNQYK